MKASEAIISELAKLKDVRKAKDLQRFFKTGPGEYGEGDVFWGLTVPQVRAVVRQYFRSAGLGDVRALLKSKVHEQRFAGLQILAMRFKIADERERSSIAKFYLVNAKSINNWDLVDTSAPYILGEYLAGKDRVDLYRLARSRNLWERRIAVLSTFAFIKRDDFKDAMRIAEQLLSDRHDLMHKAVGWMLREVGKRDLKAETVFLDRHARVMPRTMLRYAIERFPEPMRRKYLKMKG